MSHSLIQQTKEKRREVFGVVKERIVTTQPSSVIEEVQQTGALGGLLSLCGPKALKVQEIWRRLWPFSFAKVNMAL